MSQAYIQTGTGGSAKKFLIEGFLTHNERKSQQSPPLPIPTQADNRAVLTSILGQVREFTLSFILIDRDDDYTDGTGSPGVGPYSILEQKQWIMDEVFSTSGTHYFVDEQGTVMEGRIQAIEYTKAGDDPYSDSVTLTFTRGIAF